MGIWLTKIRKGVVYVLERQNSENDTSFGCKIDELACK